MSRGEPDNTILIYDYNIDVWRLPWAYFILFAYFFCAASLIAAAFGYGHEQNIKSLNEILANPIPFIIGFILISAMAYGAFYLLIAPFIRTGDWIYFKSDANEIIIVRRYFRNLVKMNTSKTILRASDVSKIVFSKRTRLVFIMKSGAQLCIKIGSSRRFGKVKRVFEKYCPSAVVVNEKYLAPNEIEKNEYKYNLEKLNDGYTE